MIDPINALAFSINENKGVYAVLLGSGVSRAAQIPTGWEVVLQLTARVAGLEGVTGEPDWSAWHQTRFGEPPSYSKLIDALAQTPDERRAILHRLIEPTAAELEDGVKVPTAAHRAVARLVRDGHVRVIITTNFDRLMENALREVGVEPTVVKSDDDLQGATPLIHTRCLILKVHGDYLDTRLRNTEGELAGYSPALDSYLDRVLDEHGLIVCGWSGDWDEALRGAITRAPNRRYPLFWASHGAPSPLASDVIIQRGGRVIPINGADGFFEDLQTKVSVQAETQHAHPQSTALLVAATKRLLGRRENRIPLADLLAEEVRRAQERLAGQDLGPHGRATPDEFRRRVAVYEAVLEPLCHIAFTLGRWGDGAELATAQEALLAFAVKRFEGGTVVWLELATYPAVLIFTAFGVGAAHARRYADLRTWFATPVRQPHHRSTSSAAEELFLTAWGGGKKETWNLIAGMENRQAPLSDHLFEVFEPLVRRELLGPQDVELAYAAFEMLVFLHLSTQRHNHETFARANDYSQGGRGFAWLPIGRLGWDERPREIVMERLEPAYDRAALLAAGYAGGDEPLLELMIQNLVACIDHFRW